MFYCTTLYKINDETTDGLICIKTEAIVHCTMANKRICQMTVSAYQNFVLQMHIHDICKYIHKYTVYS